MDFNNQWFYEETLLHLLYIYTERSTKTLESFFNNDHPQLINNMISNRHETTNYIARGLMEYDSKLRKIAITEKGKNEIIMRYTGKRG